ncbi:MAG: M20/M25/M40 family metallo-hydrolase, partial [Methanomicrobiales archaeon]|nr:M20/M25/M40 family metallo-hydrolase [Methanomicrobiales archaeon]
CAELIRIRSDNPPGDTAEVIEYISGYLDALGIDGTIVRRRGGRCNLVAGDVRAPLLFCGHVDVVPAIPAGWKFGPYSGTADGGYIYGRGASDMKGGCAAILAAVHSVVDAGDELPAALAFVCDEETGGNHGIAYLVKKQLIHPCDCLIAEPTPPRNVVVGQKGLCRIDMDFHGTPGHGSLYPRVGVSAVMEAFNLLGHLRTIHEREYPVPEDVRALVEVSSVVLEEVFGIEEIRTILRSVTFNPGRILGGEKANIIAEHCRLELDLRIPWGCTGAEIVAEIRAAAPRASLRITDCSEPNCTPADAPIVVTTCRQIERVYGVDAVPIIQWAASDAKVLRAAGFNVVEYGPGEVTTLHGIDELVSVIALEAAAEVYCGIMCSYASASRPS